MSPPLKSSPFRNSNVRVPTAEAVGESVATVATTPKAFQNLVRMDPLLIEEPV
jgi:hypothetical protein